jgi:hypothetical protein
MKLLLPKKLAKHAGGLLRLFILFETIQIRAKAVGAV